MGIATAAKEAIQDGMTVTIGGGVESISLVQNDKMNRYRAKDPVLEARVPQLYMTMLETAEIVADRYEISREAQDAYALRSQQALPPRRRPDASTPRSRPSPRQ